MKELLFFMSILALGVYIITICYASVAYCNRKNELKLKFIVLTSIFVIENIVIYVYSYLSSVFGYSSEIVYIIYFFINSLYIALIRLITRDITGSEITNWELVLYGVFVVLQIAFLVLRNIAFFFTASSVMFLVISVETLFAVKKNKTDSRQMELLIISSIVFGVLVVLEDKYLPKYVAAFYDMMPNTYINSFSLNALAVIHCLFIIRYCRKSIAESSRKKSEPAINIQEQARQIIDKYNLTNREQDIVKLLLKEKTNKEIAEELYISVGTVKSHTHNIFTKCEVSSKKELYSLYK